MKNSKKLAIYLDHSQAKLFDFKNTAIEFKTIESEFDYHEKKEILQKGESHLHHKEQNLQHQYYKNLGDEILNYHEVLLFGPTDAKTELFNYLSEIKKFEKIKIIVKTSDKLTENQQLELINSIFSE
jgi:stalled ribosome rescue protein Dom34